MADILSLLETLEWNRGTLFATCCLTDMESVQRFDARDSDETY